MSGLPVLSGAFIGALLMAATATWIVLFRIHRKLSRAPRAVVCLMAVLLTITVAADAVNAYFSYLPRLGDVIGAATEGGSDPHLRTTDLRPSTTSATVRSHPHGAVLALPVPDRGSGFGATTALVYLPPQYFDRSQRRFPVLYLIHGSPGIPADWLRGGQAADAGDRVAVTGHPVIIVMPRMSHGWLDDPECVDGIGERVETHLLRDVVPAVEATLRIEPGWTNRGIAGMSAGGYCALNLGLRNRFMFGSIIDMSGLTRPTHTGGLRPLFGAGPQAPAAALANSPDLYIDGLGPGPRPQVWLDVGRHDRKVAGAMRHMHDLLDANGYLVQLHVRPGVHTFTVWRPALRDALSWFAADVARVSAA
ncbi:esterase family protein [Frankia sp. CiP3]|uniref:alpha/beta hydrolase n=1 Tax=Frankia sp. CiP3 TaxID=2880971 RepID=UPI001EF705E8|nr:alpha/beta hydrolase-fold protein [Frankia sp. CiP3]